MALVAYSDDSDLGSDSEEVGEDVNGVQKHVESKPSSVVVPVGPGLPVKNESCPVASSRSEVKSSHVASSKSEVKYSGIDDIVDEDDDVPMSKDKPSILASIPAAIPVNSLGLSQDNMANEVEDDLTDVPTVDNWKVIADIKKGVDEGKNKDNSKPTAVKAAKKKKVKIFIPALSEFDDDDEDEPEPEPERKKAKPSATGTGLFSVLPEPKHITVKETKRALVPHVLTKAPPAPKPPKRKPIVEKKPEALDGSDEDDGEVSDFFSLSASDAVVTAGSESFVQPFLPNTQVAHTRGVEMSNKKPSHKYEEQVSNEPVYGAQQQDDMANTVQTPDEVSQQHPGIDQEAMIRLMGKRRGKGEEINFINVSADDALLTRDEWMTKALSEEKPTHSYSKKREGMPTQKQKQKHQITYLAHQAKEREIELKNNWAQNRVTKMQTQAKYGF